MALSAAARLANLTDDLARELADDVPNLDSILATADAVTDGHATVGELRSQVRTAGALDSVTDDLVTAIGEAASDLREAEAEAWWERHYA